VLIAALKRRSSMVSECFPVQQQVPSPSFARFGMTNIE
jgi:hypothetical protein